MKRALGIVVFTVFLDLLGFGLVLPLLPVYAAEPRFAASRAEIGLLFACYSFMQFLFAPVWGRLSDRVGRRPVLLLSICGSGTSYLLFAFAPSLAWLFVSRVFAGMMAANLSTAMAYVADVTAPEDRAKGMGMVGAAFGLGFIFGPAMATVVGHWGQQGVGLTAAALSFTDVVLASLFLPESLPPERRAASKAPGRRLARMAGALRHPAVGPPVVIFFLATLAFSGFETTLSLFLTDRLGPLTPGQLGGFFAFGGLVVAFIQGGLAGRIVRRAGEPRVALAACALAAAGYLFLAAADGRAALFASLAVIAAGQGIGSPAINSLISRATPADEQGSIMGVNMGFSSLARTVGPTLAGALAGLRPEYPYFAAAALMILACALAARVLTQLSARPPVGAG